MEKTGNLPLYAANSAGRGREPRGSWTSLIFDIVTLFEAVYPAGGIDKFLLAGKEGVALGAYFHGNIPRGGAGFDNITAGAGNFYRFIVGVYIWFHRFLRLIFY
jgi:hypothetical protein